MTNRFLPNHFILNYSILQLLMYVRKHNLSNPKRMFPLCNYDLGNYIIGYQHQNKFAYCRLNDSHIKEFLNDWELLY